MFERFFSTYAGPADSNIDNYLDDIVNEVREIRTSDLAITFRRYFLDSSCPLVRNY